MPPDQRLQTQNKKTGQLGHCEVGRWAESPVTRVPDVQRG